MPPSASFIKIDTPGLGLEDGTDTMEVGEKVCAFDIAKREENGAATEDGSIEGGKVGLGAGVSATRLGGGTWAPLAQRQWKVH